MLHRSLRRGRRPRRLCVFGLGTFALALTACGPVGPENRQNSLRPKGESANKIDNLFQPVLWVAIVIGILVVGATIVFALRFRHRPGGDDRPKQIHGSTPLEIGWTIVPALIMAIVAVPTVSTIFDLAEKAGPGALQVSAIGKQWWWQFDYTNGDADDRVVTANDLHIPTGRDVQIKLKACDASLPNGVDGSAGCNVIHSFWVPELAGKTDVVPGRVNTMRLRADRPGTYLGQCAEYCGLSHANMRFRVIAESPDDFAAWLANERSGPKTALADAGEATELFQQKYQCTNCHTTEDSSISVYGPNLTHLGSRTTFASGYFELTRPKLIEWIMDAPSLIPMQSDDCRVEPLFSETCVGMPSFTKNTPKGAPVMTRADAEVLADYLLSLK